MKILIRCFMGVLMSLSFWCFAQQSNDINIDSLKQNVIQSISKWIIWNHQFETWLISWYYTNFSVNSAEYLTLKCINSFSYYIDFVLRKNHYQNLYKKYHGSLLSSEHVNIEKIHTWENGVIGTRYMPEMTWSNKSDLYHWIAYKEYQWSWKILIDYDGFDCLAVDNIPTKYQTFFKELIYPIAFTSSGEKITQKHCFDHKTRGYITK